MSEQACVFDCGNEASMCTPCVSAGNDMLKRDLACRRDRIDAALETCKAKLAEWGDVNDHDSADAKEAIQDIRAIRAALTGADE